MPPYISKSKYLTGLQCPKLLWHHYNAKDQLPSYDSATEAIFDQGHEVGELAKQLFPDGIDIEWDIGFDEVLKQSHEALSQRRPLFEAGFTFNGTYARVDVLDPVDDGQWDIIEVKMGTGVKDINYHDLALQRYCYEGAGVSVRRCYLMHINNEYVRHGDIDPEQLLIREDVTDTVLEYSAGIEEKITEMAGVIALKECPVCDIGPHCDDPYTCVLKEMCWAEVWKYPDNVFTLPNARGRDWELYGQGNIRTNQIPQDFELSTKQQILVDADRTSEPYIDKAAIKQFLDTLTYPLYFLDFETFGLSTAIPLIDNTRPYQHVPFQYSLHVQDAPESEPIHHSWLWDGEGDPRQEMLQNLQELLGSKGSVVAYNAGYEGRMLRESAEAFPGYTEWVCEIQGRIADLLAPFRSFSIYYPAQHGSASMKAVLPALTGKSYTDLAISDGGQACGEFVRVTFGNVNPVDRDAVRNNLEEYCGLDTMGMVDIVCCLRGIT